MAVHPDILLNHAGMFLMAMLCGGDYDQVSSNFGLWLNSLLFTNFMVLLIYSRLGSVDVAGKQLSSFPGLS